MARGSLPADILLIGEAPGAAEDSLGQPFIGPAGKLLDSVIATAVDWAGLNKQPRICFTNLVGCVPKRELLTIGAPRATEIKACSGRLEDLLLLAKPRAIVMVGKLSSSWVPKILDYEPEASADLLHPSAILRGSAASQPLQIQRITVQLQDLFEKLYPEE